MPELDLSSSVVSSEELIKKRGTNVSFFKFDDTSSESMPWLGQDTVTGTSVTGDVVFVSPISDNTLTLGIKVSKPDLFSKTSLLAITAISTDLEKYDYLRTLSGRIYHITFVEKLSPDGSSPLLQYVGLKE